MSIPSRGEKSACGQSLLEKVNWNLANILQHPNSRLQKTNMKYWERQLDITEMSIAFGHRLAASLTVILFAGDAHTRVKYAILDGNMATGNISIDAIAHLKNALL